MIAPVRAATVDDLPELRRLEAAGMGADAWGSSALADELAGVPDTRTVLVAPSCDGAGLAAYGVLMGVGPTADVQRVVVDPTRRRRGLGRLVLRRLLDDAAARGCVEVLLEVREHNDPAVALYAAHGFVEISRRRGYYSAQGDALVLRLPLATGGGEALR